MQKNKFTMLNGNIMVKEVVRTEEEEKSSSGIFIPKEILEDEQVSQGKVVKTDSENIAIGDLVLFHKVMPVDVRIKIDKDEELQSYFFILEKDIICKITE